MENKIVATIKKYKMLSQGDKVVLAVSGGVDSMVMLEVISKIKSDFDLTVIVAHLNHAVRPESAREAELVRDVAARLGVIYEEDTLPKMGHVGNFHAYAREYRYNFFTRVARRHGATKIATGHHADDHLETVVHRLMKTCTPYSLIGIKPVIEINGVQVIRPLIECQKDELYEYARRIPVAFMEDTSNNKDDYLRNRIRKYITPFMTEENPLIAKHARELSHQLSDDEFYFQEQVTDLFKFIKCGQASYELSYDWFQSLAPSLSRRLLRRLLPDITVGGLSELIGFLASAPASGHLDIGGGLVVAKAYDLLSVTTLDKIPQTVDEFEYEIPINEEICLPNGKKLIMHADFTKKDEKRHAEGTYLCYNSLQMPLRVRNRRSGDKIELNNGQHAKIKQLFIDAKIPVYEREKVPLIVDANDEIIWIPWLRATLKCLKQPSSNNDLWLEIYE